MPSIQALDSCLCLLKRADLSLVMLMHVDDLLFVGSRNFIRLEVAPTLLEKYKVSLEILQKPGDELEFLKRVSFHIRRTLRSCLNWWESRRFWRPKTCTRSRNGQRFLTRQKSLMQTRPPSSDLALAFCSFLHMTS